MHEIRSLVQDYGLSVVFLSVLVERSGLLVPSQPVLLVAGALSLSGGLPVPWILLAATAGALTADLLWYLVGARIGRRTLALLCKLSLSPDSCVRRTENAFVRMGPWILLFAKFVPGLGYISAALCGIARVRLSMFIVLDALGSAVYVGLFIVLGELFHDGIDVILETLVQMGIYGAAIVAGAFICYLATRWIDRQAFIHRLKMDRISVEELAEMIDKGQAPLILDVRPPESRLRDGMICGAVGANKIELSAILKDYPRDMEVVVYCSCPNEASAAVAALHLKRAGFKNIRPLLGGIEAWANAGHPVVATEITQAVSRD